MISIGNAPLNKIFLGNNEINKIYMGNELVYNKERKVFIFILNGYGVYDKNGYSPMSLPFTYVLSANKCDGNIVLGGIIDGKYHVQRYDTGMNLIEDIPVHVYNVTSLPSFTLSVAYKNGKYLILSPKGMYFYDGVIHECQNWTYSDSSCIPRNTGYDTRTGNFFMVKKSIHYLDESNYTFYDSGINIFNNPCNDFRQSFHSSLIRDLYIKLGGTTAYGFAGCISNNVESNYGVSGSLLRIFKYNNKNYGIYTNIGSGNRIQFAEIPDIADMDSVATFIGQPFTVSIKRGTSSYVSNIIFADVGFIDDAGNGIMLLNGSARYNLYAAIPFNIFDIKPAYESDMMPDSIQNFSYYSFAINS